MECGISENRGDSKSNETDGGGEVMKCNTCKHEEFCKENKFYQAHCIIKNYKHYTPREEK